MVKLAKAWLLEYFSDKKSRKPGELEDDFVGQWSFSLENWRQSPFFPALAELVSEGLIVYSIDTEEDYRYALPGCLPEGLEPLKD